MSKKLSNTFNEGLLMDVHPLNSLNSVLSNALNATLMTSNGYEPMLQQDMGNGRVETAYLPEGYVPIGTCEFGDIIYIVSYNPLENKSQIGCFPSPERNITSDEVTEMEQGLSWKDFQESTIDSNGDEIPSGVLKSISVKKIVYGNKSLNPGDKFIIYESDGITGVGETNGALGIDSVTLSDYANTSHKHDAWPKLVKLRIVSIEDSGRIVDLDASVKWYDNDYYIPFMSEQNGNIDIDSYRSLVSSAYSIFRSKISGKLAILAELETIENFSCSYEIYASDDIVLNTDESNEGLVATKNTTYNIWFYTSWRTSHNDVNPSGFIISKSQWENVDTNIRKGGFLRLAQMINGNVEYINEDTVMSLPHEAYANNENILYEYTRIYHLDEPSVDFDTYVTTDSYNANIDAIIDWGRETMTDDDQSLEFYHAIAPDENGDTTLIHELLGTVVSATKCQDMSGLPEIDSNGLKSYVYNVVDCDLINTSQEDDALNKYTFKYYARGSSGANYEIYPLFLTDDIINNYFGKDIPTNINNNFNIETSRIFSVNGDNIEYKSQLDGLVWNYSLTPFMPYGILDHLSVNGQIDFSKINSGEINISAWRYYATDDNLTLTWGLEAYPQNGWGIAEVVFDMCDCQGRAASYHISNKTSFSGTFTETIEFGESWQMNNVDAYCNTYVHAGNVDSEGDVYVHVWQKTGENREYSDYKPLTYDEKEALKNNEGSELTDSDFTRHENDAGIIYPKTIYLVKITVKYCTKDILGRYMPDDGGEGIENGKDFRTFYRWLIPNGIFNEQYYSVSDFINLQPGLTIDFNVNFSTLQDKNHVSPINQMEAKKIEYYNTNEMEWPSDKTMDECLYQSLGANVYAINQSAAYDENGKYIGNTDDINGNTYMSLLPGITNGFGTFALIVDNFDDIPTNVYLCQSKITKDIDAPSVVYSESSSTNGFEDSVQPVIDNALDQYYFYRYDSTEGWDPENPNKYDHQYLEKTYYNRSGYYNAHYGSSSKCLYLSSELLSLLGAEEAFISNRVRRNIYYDDTEYSSYLDSFSLNFAYNTTDRFREKYASGNGKDTGYEYSESGQKTYYDSDGNEVTSTGYVKISGTLNDMYSHTIETGQTDGGIQLTLAGITFSKIYAGEMKLNNEVKTLRSVLSTEELAEKSGLYLYDGNMYFKHLVTVGISFASDNIQQFAWGSFDTKDGFLYSNRIYDTDPDNPLKIAADIKTASSNPAKKLINNASFENSVFQEDFLTNYGGSYNIMAFAFMGVKHNNITRVDSDRIFKNIRKQFTGVELDSKKRTYIYKDEYDKIRFDFKPSDVAYRSWGDRYLPYCFAVKDSENKNYIYPIADFFVSKTLGSVDYLTTAFQYCPTYTVEDAEGNKKNIYGSDHMTLANMIASLYSQLYYVDTTAEKNTSVLLGNYISVEKYTETWHKDILVEIMPDGSLAKSVDKFDVVAFNGQRASEYLEHLANNVFGFSQYTDLASNGINMTNVDFDLLGISKAVEFTFSVPYDLGNLLYDYEDLSTVMHHLYSIFDSRHEITRVYGEPETNVLYVFDGVNTISEFSSTSIMYYCDSYEVDSDGMITPIPTENQISRNEFSALSRILKFNSDNGVTWNDVSQLSQFDTKYTITYHETFKGGYKGYKETYKDIPLCGIFNENIPT